ncbi:polysaccharide deacetylase family protein [Methanoculleus sp.]|uniref:polysaccharide deacetylase family protein n=1 Tax=Methanoculleus sp. TaxID=90427 RepID=UPI0026004AF7|nr:polysaccharide deacetylase family protein [Methanoculleus sp.]
MVTLDTDPQLLSVTPEHFAGHLEYISEHYNPISLSELYQALKAGKVPDKSVVITFDDGYADNLWNAKPLLEKYGIPATVFVTSSHVDSDREFWWDDLERLLLLSDQLPDQLELTVKGRKWNWDLSGDLGAESRRRYEIEPKSWNVTMASDPGPQHAVYRDLHRLLKPLSHEEQESILSTIAQWAGMPRTGRETHRPLNVSELKELDRGGLIEIGAHTATHTMLSMQPVGIQRTEIIRGKESLEEMLGHPVQNFSYPFGGRVDFNRKTVEIVKEAGITTACANYGLTLIGSTDPYRLPRVLVRGWDVEVFSSWMKDWFNE